MSLSEGNPEEIKTKKDVGGKAQKKVNKRSMVHEAKLLVIESKGNVHIIVSAERPAAVRTLAGSRGEALLDAVLAEHMATSLDCRVLKIPATDRAQRECLDDSS